MSTEPAAAEDPGAAAAERVESPGAEDTAPSDQEGVAERSEEESSEDGSEGTPKPVSETADGAAGSGDAARPTGAGTGPDQPPAPPEPAAPTGEDGVDEGSGAAEKAEGATEDGEAAALSEAEAEIAAQRELRERIEQRKASKEGPIEAGTKLSGTAADLLAAVRAVESGEKPLASAFREPEPARRRPAPAPAREPARRRARLGRGRRRHRPRRRPAQPHPVGPDSRAALHR
ncbi:DNA helicase RecD, partial [Streptomyces sp. G44]|nr:DNA helicase RecD [Streptomyces sp. G44]